MPSSPRFSSGDQQQRGKKNQRAGAPADFASCAPRHRRIHGVLIRCKRARCAHFAISCVPMQYTFLACSFPPPCVPTDWRQNAFTLDRSFGPCLRKFEQSLPVSFPFALGRPHGPYLHIPDRVCLDVAIRLGILRPIDSRCLYRIAHRMRE